MKYFIERAILFGILVLTGILTSCGGGNPLPPIPEPGLSPNIEPPTAPAATVGVPYNLSFRWTLNTVKPPFFWNLIGNMPPGLQFEPENGRIFGIPTTPGSYAFTMVVRDSNYPQRQESRNYTIVVNGAPGPLIITTPPPARAKKGIPYSHEIHISGGLFPYTCSVTGMLPPGITLNTQTCTLEGTPTQTGSFTFTIFVFDSQVPPNSVSATYTLNVIDPIQILTEEMPVGKVNETYGPFQLLAKGGVPCVVGPPYLWAFESGYFPPGLTLNPDGTVTGTPTESGSFDFLVRVIDCDDPTETTTANVRITIVGPLTITTTSLPECKKDVFYSAEIQVTGGVPPYSWSLDGQLAPGLSFDTSTGHITGIPQITGTFSFSITVSDSNAPPNIATASYTLTCIDPIQITTDTLPDGVMGLSYPPPPSLPFFQLQAKGGNPICNTPSGYMFSFVSGFFPPGLILNPDGTIIGIPLGPPKTYDFLVGVEDCDGESTTKNLSILIAEPLSITSPLTLPSATTGVPYFFQFTASGGTPPLTWSPLSGILPPGLSLSPSGLLSGSGAPLAPGTYKLNIRVADSANPPQEATQDPILVVETFGAVTMSVPNGEQGVAYATNVDILGGTPSYCWFLDSGSLPPTIAANTVFGVPQAGTTFVLTSGGFPLAAVDVGTWNFRIEFRDDGDGDGAPCEVNGQDRNFFVDYTLLVVPLPDITTTLLPDAYVNIPYLTTLSVSGGIGPYVWELVDAALSGGACLASGSLPPELTLNTDGTISGTPIIANTTGYDLCVRVTDVNGMTDYQQLLLRVLQDVVLCVDGLNGDDFTGDGTSARPFKTINKALSYTSDNNLDTSGTLPRIGAIRVAGTGFGPPLVYHENISLRAPMGTDVDLLGGWTGFAGDYCAIRGNVPNARIKGLASNNGPTIITEGLTRDTWIELFEIEGNNAPWPASLAIYNAFFPIIPGPSSPTIARNIIRGGNATGAGGCAVAGGCSVGIYTTSFPLTPPSAPLIVENNIYGGTGSAETRGVWDDNGSTSEIRDNTIDGGDPSGGGITTSVGVKSSNGSTPLIYDNTITGGTGFNSYGIWVDPADANIARNIIHCEGSATTDICAGIYVNGSTITNPISANSINELSTSGMNALGNSTRGIWLDAQSSATILGHNPSIYGGEGSSTAYVILLENASTATIGGLLPGEPNNINGGGCNLLSTPNTWGIKLSSGSAALIVGNTINGGCGTITSTAIGVDPATATVSDNTINGGGSQRSYGILAVGTGTEVDASGNDVNGGSASEDAHAVAVMDGAMVTLTENTMYGGGSQRSYGILVTGSGSYADVSGNGISGGSAQWDAQGIVITDGADASLSSNTIDGGGSQRSYGILIAGTTEEIPIFGNDINTGNADAQRIGVWIEDTTSPTLRNNDIFVNGAPGVRVCGIVLAGNAYVDLGTLDPHDPGNNTITGDASNCWKLFDNRNDFNQTIPAFGNTWNDPQPPEALFCGPNYDSRQDQGSDNLGIVNNNCVDYGQPPS